MLIVLSVFLCKLSLLDLTFSSMNSMTRQMHISEHFVSFVTSSANVKCVFGFDFMKLYCIVCSQLIMQHIRSMIICYTCRGWKKFWSIYKLGGNVRNMYHSLFGLY